MKLQQTIKVVGGLCKAKINMGTASFRIIGRQESQPIETRDNLLKQQSHQNNS